MELAPFPEIGDGRRQVGPVAMQPECLGELQAPEVLGFKKALDEIAHVSVLGGTLDFYV
jgi:hypothetical protein